MYKIEVIAINPTDDVFIDDVCLSTQEEKDDCRKQMYLVSREYIINEGKELGVVKYKSRLENGYYQERGVIKSFSTIDNAHMWWKLRVTLPHPYRDLERQFYIDRNILSEINVIDENDNVVSNIHSCYTNTCIRFGNCVTISQGGCFSDNRLVDFNKPKGFKIPIKVEN